MNASVQFKNMEDELHAMRKMVEKHRAKYENAEKSDKIKRSEFDVKGNLTKLEKRKS